MPPIPGPGLLRARYRAAPGYTIVPADSLSAATSLAGGGDALLRPRAGWARPVRLIDRATAGLLAALAQPATAPREAAGATDLARLVLDGVLEVEWKGGWHTGPAAHALYFDGTPAALGDGPLARLSREGLEYAAALRLRHSGELAGRLYRWNTVPDTPLWRRRLPTTDAVAAFLDVDRAIAAAGLTEVTGHRSAWREWSPANAPTSADPATIYKLYLSPATAATPTTLSRILPILPRLSGLLGLKLGRERHALLRPDKVLFYFPDPASLRTAARQLTAVLEGIPAHGVPFTAALDDSGLLSWGADPPEVQEGEDTSWRVWLCERLASALTLVELSGDRPVPAWHFALDRLTLDGVDVESWSPISGRWEPSIPAPDLRAGSADGTH